MRKVPATQAAKRFSQLRQAAQHEPVAVTHHNRVTEVLISKRDYDDYVRLKGLETRALWASELSADAPAGLMEAAGQRTDDVQRTMDQIAAFQATMPSIPVSDILDARHEGHRD